jgi:hypothetical protein
MDMGTLSPGVKQLGCETDQCILAIVLISIIHLNLKVIVLIMTDITLMNVQNETSLTHDDPCRVKHVAPIVVELCNQQNYKKIWLCGDRPINV